MAGSEASFTQTEWTDYGGVSTIAGWTTPTANIWYKRVGSLVFVNFYITGTSSTTGATFTLPFTSVNVTNGGLAVAIGGADNGSALTAPASANLPLNSATVTCYKDMATTTWTGSGTKTVNGQFFYQTV